MIMREIVCTCSNAHIAGAALASIGGDFARDIAVAARRRDMPPGVLVANLVKDFARGAAAEEWKAADQAARGADQPILSGLRFIVGASLRRQRQGTNAFRARHAEK
jgi:hypothetical protein